MCGNAGPVTLARVYRIEVAARERIATIHRDLSPGHEYRDSNRCSHPMTVQYTVRIAANQRILNFEPFKAIIVYCYDLLSADMLSVYLHYGNTMVMVL